MDKFDGVLILEITLLEVLICGIVSLFGSSVRVLCFKRNNKSKLNIKQTVSEILTNAIIDTFISIAASPFVMGISPRLIIIPPLILGLLGSDFIKLLTSINGIFSLFEKIFHLYNSSHSQKEEDQSNNSSPIQGGETNINIGIGGKNNHHNRNDALICKLIISTSDALISEMDIEIRNYYVDNDSLTFYTIYLEIDKGYNNVKDTIEKLECVPVDVYIKIMSLVKKKSEFEQFYKNNVKGK